MVEQENVTVQPTQKETATMTRCMMEAMGPAFISAIITHGLTKRLINNLDIRKPYVDRLKRRGWLVCIPAAFSMAYFVATSYNSRICKPRILSLPGPRSEFQTVLERQSNGEKINVTFLQPTEQSQAAPQQSVEPTTSWQWRMTKPDKITAEPSAEEKKTLTRCWAAACVPALALSYISYRLVDMGRQVVMEYVEAREYKSSFKDVLKRAPKAHIIPTLSATLLAYYALTNYNELVCKPKLLALPPSEYQEEFIKRSLPENDRSEEVREAVTLQFGTWEVEENIVDEVCASNEVEAVDLIIENDNEVELSTVSEVEENIIVKEVTSSNLIEVNDGVVEESNSVED